MVTSSAVSVSDCDSPCDPLCDPFCDPFSASVVTSVTISVRGSVLPSCAVVCFPVSGVVLTHATRLSIKDNTANVKSNRRTSITLSERYDSTAKQQ